MMIDNDGSVDHQRLSVSSAVAETIELHDTKEAGGMMEMSPAVSVQTSGTGGWF